MIALHTHDDLARLQERAAVPAFAAALRRLRRETNEFVAGNYSVPERAAGFYHNYFCPEHAVELLFDPSHPERHRCPRDGRLFTGEPFDSAWLWFVNNRLSTNALALALRWRIEADDEQLARVVAILTDYAARYRGYQPETPRPFGKGKATFQSLDEAVWLIALVRAYDLVKEALPDATSDVIEGHLLRPAAEHIRSQKFLRIHNIENWHNAALAAVGLCLGDDGLVRLAVDEEFGFHHQLAEGVRDDGLWWEGSSSYHFYALYPLVILAQIGAPSGRALWQHERLERMFRTPIDLAFPDLRLPASNDCWFFCSLMADVCHGIPPARGFYEIAHAWYDDPAFAWVLGRNYRERERDSLEALIHGRDTVATEERLGLRSVNCEPSGFALLRSADELERQDCLLLKYGPHGGGHGHPDKLGVFVYAGGDPVCPDLGTPGYGIELNDSWYRQTLSHSALIVDGRSQPEADGELVSFDPGSRGFAVVDARVDFSAPPYAGVAMRRVIFWASGYYIDFAHVVCRDERQIDCLFHVRAERAAAQGLGVDADAPDLVGDGYEHISAVAAHRAEARVNLRWRLPRGTLSLHLPDEGGTTLVRGRVPYNPAAESGDLLIRRRRARETGYLAVVAFSQQSELTVTPWSTPVKGAWGVEVAAAGQNQRWVVCSPASQSSISAGEAGVNTYVL